MKGRSAFSGLGRHHIRSNIVILNIEKAFFKGKDQSIFKLSKQQTSNCLVHFYKRCVVTSLCFVKGEDHSNVKVSKRQTDNCLVHFYKRCVATSVCFVKGEDHSNVKLSKRQTDNCQVWIHNYALR